MVIVRYRAEIVIQMLMVDRSSAFPGAGRKRRGRKRSAAPSCLDLKRWRVISTKDLTE